MQWRVSMYSCLKLYSVKKSNKSDSPIPNPILMSVNMTKIYLQTLQFWPTPVTELYLMDIFFLASPRNDTLLAMIFAEMPTGFPGSGVQMIVSSYIDARN